MDKKDKVETQELKNLDVDRVDGVDKPATGRNFLLFKRAAQAQKLSAAELDGVAKAVFPLEDQPARSAQDDWLRSRGTDDNLGRWYSDAVYERLGGSGNAAQDAEHRLTVEPGLVDAAGAKFTSAAGELHKPTQDYIDAAPSGAVRVGPNYVMSPNNSGIADAGMFRAPEPTVVLKRREGLFTDAIMAPLTEESGIKSSFFDTKDVKKSAPKELGSGMFRDIIG